MPYKRKNWTLKEISYGLANWVSAPNSPHAHSRIHAVKGELYENALFQKGRVQSIIHTNRAKESNAKYWQKKSDGSYQNNSKTRKKHPLPKPEVSTHSTLARSKVAAALCKAFNHPHMQPFLEKLDGGFDMKVNVNFKNSIGTGLVHKPNQPSVSTPMMALFVYCKPNPGNKDMPIFHTVVPMGAYSSKTPNICI